MKQGTLLNKVVMTLFFAAIILYMGGAAWRGLRDPYPTVQAYTYVVEDTMEATGYLVRQEQVIHGWAIQAEGTEATVRLLPSEGEKIAAGTTVALLYSDGAAMERSQRLETLEAEAAQLREAITAGENGQGEQIGRKVTSSMVALRRAVEAGDFTRLESQVGTFKSAVYQQAQRYGNGDDLAAALAAAQNEINTLRALTPQEGVRVTVPQSGIFSGQVDGYETVLVPEITEGVTPSLLDSLESRAVEEDSSALGKLITNSQWYFIFSLGEEQTKRLTVGRAVPVRFSRDWSGTVDMTVERISLPENGRVAVVLSTRKFLSETTLLRRQTVELIFDSQMGIRVPLGAVRVEEQTETDKESGETRTVQVTGVYVQVGAFAEFKPVTVLAQGEDYYMVRPLLPENADTVQQKLALRAGDSVIIASEEIWDGKVIE